LSRECLRYLYRLLFLFYVEARPSLGYAPMNSAEYRDGYFLDDSVCMLFGLIYQGFSPARQLAMAAGAESEVVSQAHGFEIKPLDGDLFDESRTPILRRVRFRNHVWQQVLELLGYSRQGGALGRARVYPQGTFIYRLNGRNPQKSVSYYTPESYVARPNSRRSRGIRELDRRE
jgi:hypothetical protein